MPANDERSAVCLLCYDNLGHWPSAKRVDDLDCHYLVRFFMHTLRPCCDLRRQMFCVRQCVLATVNYTITTLITSPSSCPVTAANFLILCVEKKGNLLRPHYYPLPEHVSGDCALLYFAFGQESPLFFSSDLPLWSATLTSSVLSLLLLSRHQHWYTFVKYSGQTEDCHCLHTVS